MPAAGPLPGSSQRRSARRSSRPGLATRRRRLLRRLTSCLPPNKQRARQPRSPFGEMGLLTPAAFLSALPALFQGTQSKGSLYLTVKRVKRLRGRKGEALCEELHCLVRAKAGKRRISTTVPDAEAEDFRAELAVVLGENMTGLLKEGEETKGGGRAKAGAAAVGASDKKKKKKRR